MSMILSRLNLIPRYNWDYGFREMLKGCVDALTGASSKKSSFKEIFGLEPIFTNSGRTSLYAILKALDLPPGSKVGVPLFCCPVVFEAISQAGHFPEFLDVDDRTYTVSAKNLASKMDGLAAVVVVHMFGHPAEMDAIADVCANVPIIEDCAHSLYSRYKGQLTGTLSTAAFFSFRSGKYLSVGEGSAILTKERRLSKAIREIVSHFGEGSIGQEVLGCAFNYLKSTFYHRPWYGTIGYPIGRRLDTKLNLSAKTGFKTGKIANCNMRLINERMITFAPKIERQRQHALYLLEKLKPNGVQLPFERESCVSNYYQFAVKVMSEAQRDMIAERLFERGVDTVKYLDEIVEFAAAEYSYDGSCPNSELISKTILVIPGHYTLPRARLDYIASSLNHMIQQ